MKRKVLISSTILAIITVLELSQASKALPVPETVQPTVNNEVEELLKSDISIQAQRRRGRRGRRCRDEDGGFFPCSAFVMPQEIA